MLKLLKIDHVCLNVADPRAAAARYAVQFGLEVREQGDDRATLACDYEPYSLELVRGEPLGAGPHRLAAAAVVLARRRPCAPGGGGRCRLAR